MIAISLFSTAIVTQTTVDFADIEVETPTLERVKAEYETIHATLERSPERIARQRALQQWDALRRRINTWSALTALHFSQDTRNEAYRKAQEYYDELQPKLTALEVELKRKLLSSENRAELEDILGKHAFKLWEADVTAFEPIIEADLVEEANLVNQYVGLLASAEIEFAGEIINLSEIERYTEDRDRQIRYRAEKARWQFFSQHQERFDGIYDRLVKLRHQMACKLGYENFIGLGYRRMQRVDYTEADVNRYRDEVVREVVPLAAKIIAQKAEKLDLDKVYFWDESVFDLQGNPQPQGEYDWMLERARQMFDEMHPELGNFFG